MTEAKKKSTTESKENRSTSKRFPGLGHLKLKRFRGWLVVVGVVALLICAVAYVLVGVVSDKTDIAYNEPNDPRFPKQEVKMEQLNFEALQAKVSQLELRNQYKDAKKLVKYQKYYHDNKQAQLLYAALCANQGNQKEALQTMLNIEKQFGESGTLAGSIAAQAVAAKDRKLAKEYYEKAIRLTRNDESNPVRNTDVKLYQKELKKLEEK